MRRLLAAIALAVSAAASCNPIVGIVSREEGPTWCEQDAQATHGGYCRDYDRDASPTVAPELAATFPHGTLEVTDAESSSPPNSLLHTAPALGKGEGAEVGHLAVFGPMPGSQGLAAFNCQADVLAKDLAMFAAAGLSLGVVGVGAQSASASGRPELAVLALAPDGQLVVQLLQLASQASPPHTVAQCPAGVLPGVDGGLTTEGGAASEWVTLQLSLERERQDAGALGCTLVAPEVSMGMDGGKDAGVEGGASRTSYILEVGFNFFTAGKIRLVDDGFIGRPSFTYGIFLEGPSPAVSLHIDNVRCTMGSAH